MTKGARGYYFRPRPNGAMLLQIRHDPRLRRTEMHRIAGIDTATGDVRVAENHVLTDEEQALIADWLANGTGLDGRAARAVSDIGHIAHWAQFRATAEELESATDELLWAMQDLREVLVRKLARRSTE
ncbi:hypothetical protein [Roseinatronobacter alkalisoli]|uniref:Uncharacterized protein n=1 Tax=Roseinatronobacter alkalisoli TaxID=3028235 RepID=A0ABT5T9C0_9RHOB|nr:hypothetical protein [Roseinatronobacter sp. HJB301]MDD7970772.1 hypothetical protein [Roseinatronobacter sp. HJB301]